MQGMRMHDIQHLQRNIIYHFHKGTFLWMTCIVKTSITRTLCHSNLSRSVSAKYGLHEGYICCFSAEADALRTGDQIPLMTECPPTKDAAWMVYSLIAIRSRKDERARLELLELLPIALERTTSLPKIGVCVVIIATNTPLCILISVQYTVCLIGLLVDSVGHTTYR